MFLKFSPLAVVLMALGTSPVLAQPDAAVKFESRYHLTKDIRYDRDTHLLKRMGTCDQAVKAGLACREVVTCVEGQPALTGVQCGDVALRTVVIDVPASVKVPLKPEVTVGVKPEIAAGAIKPGHLPVKPLKDAGEMKAAELKGPAEVCRLSLSEEGMITLLSGDKEECKRGLQSL